MIQPTPIEQAAIQSCLQPLGEYVGSIGMQRPLAEYSKAEVLQLIEVVISAYQKQMVSGYQQRSQQSREQLETQIIDQEVPF